MDIISVFIGFVCLVISGFVGIWSTDIYWLQMSVLVVVYFSLFIPGIYLRFKYI